MQQHEISPELLEWAGRLDNLISNAEVIPGPIVVPALAVLLGRYIAFEAGDFNRISEGVSMVQLMVGRAAIVEGTRIYQHGGRQ